MTPNNVIEDSGQASERVPLRNLAVNPAQAARLSRLAPADTSEQPPARQFSSSI